MKNTLIFGLNYSRMVVCVYFVQKNIHNIAIVTILFFIFVSVSRVEELKTSKLLTLELEKISEGLNESF